jgi:hypothetical protein
MITWIKPSGIEITTNELEETIDYAVSLGWEPVVPEEAPAEDVDASGVEFDPAIHWKNRRVDSDGNWMVKKAQE